MQKNLTVVERPYLDKNYNYTDGHAYRPWSIAESKIIDDSASIFHNSNRQQQSVLESEYVTTFLTLAKQTTNFDYHKFLQCTSASLGIEVIANYLRMNNMSLTLVEPCFDNLADIFRRHSIKLESICDENFDNGNFIEDLNKIKTNAICLVSPNNPTGISLSKDNFTFLVKYCSKNNILLIMDFCFRAYLPENLIVDNYEILANFGKDYFIIEDTGKTWPLSELKAPFICISNSIYDDIYNIWTDMILHVSPFVLSMMTKLIQNSIHDQLYSVKSIIQKNRDSLYKCLERTGHIPQEKDYLSVSWIKLNNYNESEMVSLLELSNIHVLPGSYFFWSMNNPPQNFIRIALTRDTMQFKEATTIMTKLLHS